MTSIFSTASAGLLCASLSVLAAPAAAREQPSGAGAIAILAQYEMTSLPNEPFWEDPEQEEELDPVLAIPTLIAPTLDKSFAYHERARRSGLARPEVETSTIRRGLGAVSRGPYAATERAVGFKIGPDLLSFETAIVSGAGTWQGSDTRLDWSLARRSTAAGNGLLWRLSTGGGFGMAGSGSHNVNAMLGYRYSLFDNVTLISEIALASNYAFASQAMPEATLTPQLQLVTDLGLAPGTPWKTTLDVKMNRERQLGGGDVRGGGSAMLRFELGPR
ncbi:hypothetical protein [Bosea rubneri]|uniref:MetA-pathway of phenol degradation n=1 Tax=Bosea rubneri TaxID=3075434 RepID=A0ABU3S4H4_9HYPH|nr:hypothetical protein [Bosea sp. ZW T0_25]MDU0339680.1 hypothetical protein [Bosea sp. ZW T0_25]